MRRVLHPVSDGCPIPYRMGAPSRIAGRRPAIGVGD
jgi:hypothetical protein